MNKLFELLTALLDELRCVFVLMLLVPAGITGITHDVSSVRKLDRNCVQTQIYVSARKHIWHLSACLPTW